ncbi:N-acetyl-alpha-D-glucosaminyl L-malate synthase BshA [Shewanella putrefaciens]|uniref:glycosyltransferase family 4 protein n=1 Tax=Shewanella putrefaciens TaxID=24 RepID=UPI000DF9B13B|nr:glycosyltransferase family 4 protein [Shewanella putrefaciens]SUJ07224.1 N-acetyl-alpha-D-glucosaminyl L-malate synthase BshA [Shewanella putrefaciens]
MKNRKSLLFWGELPPTVYHGISISNERILSTLESSFNLYKVQDNTSFGGIVWSLISFVISLSKLVYFSCKKVSIYYLNLPMSYLGLWKVYLSVLFVKFFSPKAKVVAHLHRGDFLSFIESPRNKALVINFLNKADIVFVLSNTSKKELINSGLICKSKVEVLHNTVSINTAKADIIKSISDTLIKSNFYCLSNYIPTKRIHHLVKIANEIPLPSVLFNGAPSSDSYMQSLVALNINSVCHFNGVVNGAEKESLLRECKALVLPSLNEGMPLVILESLAQATPVICYDIGFISDYLGDDYPGLVKELTDNALKDKILWMNSLSYEEYVALRKLSFNLFWDQFDINKINRSVSTLFNRL